MQVNPQGGALRPCYDSINPPEVSGGGAGHFDGASAPVRNNAKSLDQRSWQDARHGAYKAKNTAANILLKQGDKLAGLGKRLSHCRYVARSTLVTLEKGEQRARFDGVKSCSSVWCCPICSARISAGRRDELNALLAGARQEGLSVVMLTLTASHKRGMNLAGWLAAFKAGKERLRQRREWRALKPRFVGSVTATEVTHSDANGFHPHFHELIVMDCPEAEAMAQIEGLRAAWLASLAGVGLSGNDHAFQVQPASAAGEYVGKFGAAEEMALQGQKQGRGGSRTPWQLLADAGDIHNPRATRDGAIWAEYAAAFMGRRQLVWSPGLKARFGIDDVSDDDMPEGEVAQVPQVLRAWFGSSDTWRKARRRSVALLDAAENGTDLDKAEFGLSDADRWRAGAFGPLVEP